MFLVPFGGRVAAVSPCDAWRWQRGYRGRQPRDVRRGRRRARRAARAWAARWHGGGGGRGGTSGGGGNAPLERWPPLHRPRCTLALEKAPPRPHSRGGCGISGRGPSTGRRGQVDAAHRPFPLPPHSLRLSPQPPESDTAGAPADATPSPSRTVGAGRAGAVAAAADRWPPSHPLSAASQPPSPPPLPPPAGSNPLRRPQSLG